MDDIMKKTDDFVDAIRQTEVYLSYKEVELQLKEKPKIMAKVEEFRKRSFEIQISHKYGHYNSYEQIIALKHENEELLSEPVVKKFLDAELKLTKLMSKVYGRIADDIDFDVDFLMR